jgi:hypothetical protein
MTCARRCINKEASNSLRLMQLDEDAMEEEVVVEVVATMTTSAEAW